VEERVPIVIETAKAIDYSLGLADRMRLLVSDDDRVPVRVPRNIPVDEIAMILSC